MAKKQAPNHPSVDTEIWNIGSGANEPRPYLITVQEAEFRLKTNREGDIVQFGDVNLWDLQLTGPVTFLTQDYDPEESAEAYQGAEHPIRSLTMGTTAQFSDEDEQGEELTFVGSRKMSNLFDGPQVLRSMLKLVGDVELATNFGAWNIAANWIDHRFVIHTKYTLDANGEPRLTKGGKKITTTEVVGFDDIGIQVDDVMDIE